MTGEEKGRGEDDEETPLLKLVAPRKETWTSKIKKSKRKGIGEEYLSLYIHVYIIQDLSQCVSVIL